MVDHDDNLAEFIDEGDLDAIASELVGNYRSDKESRADWERSYIKGLSYWVSSMKIAPPPGTVPAGCFTLLTESVIRFQSQAIQELFPAAGPVKTSVVGKIDTDKEKQAHRVQDYLNYLLTEKMTEYRSETERMLFLSP